jgi:hypothetical protein
MISFETQSNKKVNLSVFDIQGRKICTLLDEKLNAGNHIISLGNQIESRGIYFCRLSTEQGTSTINRVFLK